MSINKLLTQALCISLLLLSSYAQSLTLSLNESVFATGDLLELSVVADEIEATEADVYLSVQFPDGSLYYWFGLRLQFVNERNKIVPLITKWAIQTVPETTILAFNIPTGLATGTYKWYLTLAKAGSDVAQPANWIANASTTLVLKRGEGEQPLFEEGSAGYLDGEEVAEAEMTLVSGGSISDSGESIDSSPPSSKPMDTSADDGCCDDGDMDILPSPEPPFPDDNDLPVSGTLTAGDIDDNLNFAAYQRYLNRQNDPSLPFVEMSDRVALHIVDNAGKNLSNARVRISSSINSVLEIDTYAGTDGRFYLFPKFDNVTNSQINLQFAPPEYELGSPKSVFNTTLDLGQLPEDRRLTIMVPEITATLPHSLEVMFVIDTTGSMSDELHYLITELRDIISAVQARHQQIRMRFGLVVYRDKSDAYLVRDFPFTESLNEMQIQLSEQKAQGGGDYPEAMEQALETAVNAKWSEGNVARLLFLVADAPPHDENLKAMLEQVRVARQKGLRIYPLAASGVADKAEFMMRQAEVLTQGRYLFLTDDSGVGSSHQEPSVPCYIVTHLNKLIARVIDSELAGQRIEPDDKDILRTVGHYDAGICTDENVIPPKPTTSLAQVDRIEILPTKPQSYIVGVAIWGNLRNGCEKIDLPIIPNISEDEHLFTLKVTTHSVGEVCTEALEPFMELPLVSVLNLENGTYTVNVNGVTDTFELDVHMVP
ncbi:MAG: VWA domain-containing protein [Thiomargarita sp.]|nr:VWA domain-containing protein [Thiomargarita sp.]